MDQFYTFLPFWIFFFDLYLLLASIFEKKFDFFVSESIMVIEVERLSKKVGKLTKIEIRRNPLQIKIYKSIVFLNKITNKYPYKTD